MTNMGPSTYKITHKTAYHYSAAVLQSYHMLRLRPRDVPHQKVFDHSIKTDPKAQHETQDIDYFGNPFTVIKYESDHRHLVVTSESQIEVTPPPSVAVEKTIDWHKLARGDYGKIQADEQVCISAFTAASRHGRKFREVADYARPSFAEGTPVLAGVQDLMRRIFKDFTFDAQATDVSTPVEQVLETRRGVCQDFAHLQLSALRSLGIPARYVSGYILTHPPEGQPRLQGADASHAWISVWAPETGWVDFDPTNNKIPQHEHITIAYGRDYDDVAPISGVLLGGGAHAVDVAVDVMPIAPITQAN